MPFMTFMTFMTFIVFVAFIIFVPFMTLQSHYCFFLHLDYIYIYLGDGFVDHKINFCFLNSVFG